VLIVATLARAAAARASAIDTLAPPIRARVTCSIQAATRFALPANLLIAVAEQEGGRTGQWVKNHNGSYDVGPMQFNTSYLRTLERFGIMPQDVEAAGCYPYELAAWRLRRHLDRDAGDLWTRAANYHSRTPALNARYRAAILARAAKWARWLSEHVPVVEIAPTESAPTSDPPPLLSPRTKNAFLAHATPVDRGSAPRGKHLAQSPSRAAASPRSDNDGNCTSACLVEALAVIETRRRTQLVELVSTPPPSAAGARHESLALHVGQTVASTAP
jgi:hypothetical protein